jgi:hypothetical protein
VLPYPKYDAFTSEHRLAIAEFHLKADLCTRFLHLVRRDEEATPADVLGEVFNEARAINELGADFYQWWERRHGAFVNSRSVASRHF